MKLGARLTEVGTLEIWAESKISDNRWRLQFELRKAAQTSRRSARPAAVISETAMAQARRADRATFSSDREAPSRRKSCPAKLEQTLGAGTKLLAAVDDPPARRLRCSRSPTAARTSPAIEARWLNLCGFCLRPGFGYPGRRFPHRAGAAHLRVGPAFRQSGANRDRVVDLLGPRRRRTKSQPADRYLPAPVRRCCCREPNKKAAARQYAVCCAKCGARRRAWNCCRSRPRRSSATR